MKLFGNKNVRTPTLRETGLALAVFGAWVGGFGSGRDGLKNDPAFVNPEAAGKADPTAAVMQWVGYSAVCVGVALLVVDRVKNGSLVYTNRQQRFSEIDDAEEASYNGNGNSVSKS